MGNISNLFSKKKTSINSEPSEPAENKAFNLQTLVEFVTGNYGWIILVIGILIIFEQAREHSISIWNFNEGGLIYYGEMLFVIILLCLIALLIQQLLLTLAEKSRVINILNVKHSFIEQLSTREGIPEVTKSLVRQIASIAPAVEIELFIHEQNKDWFIHAKKPVEPGDDPKPSLLPSSFDRVPCQNCLMKKNPKLNLLNSCQRDDHSLNLPEKVGYCLPLVYGSSPIGLLLLYAPKEKLLLPGQVDLLENLSGEISSAIGMVLETKAREEARMTDKIHNVQLDIARDLHDTVGQNISYLRMKLDHLSEKNAGDQSELFMEIRSMSKVANESYDLVRGTLAVLQADDSVDLIYLLSRYAEQVAERSEFTIDFTRKGTPKILSANRLRHMFYIFREALSNIEKHAKASHVLIEMLWDDKNLTLIISDDGQGYDLSKTQKVDIHYGLKFMKERAKILNGTLVINSAIGIGTKITACIPSE